MEMFEKIKKSTSFEDFLGKGMFLIFDGSELENEGGNTGEISIYDASTSKTINPNELQVCMLKNEDTQEISYSKYDFAAYLMANTTDEKLSQMPSKMQKYVRFYMDEHKEVIEKFRNGNFNVEYMTLKDFNKTYEAEIEQEIQKTKELNKSEHTQESGKEIHEEQNKRKTISEITREPLEDEIGEEDILRVYNAEKIMK